VAVVVAKLATARMPGGEVVPGWGIKELEVFVVGDRRVPGGVAVKSEC